MFILFKYFSIFCFSFIFNFIIFIFIDSGLLGKRLKDKFNNLIEKEIRKFLFVTFIICFFLLICLQSNTIYLYTPDLTVKTVVNGVEVKFSGDILNLMLTQFGTATVFATSARIAALIVTKKMTTLDKVGIIGGTATSYTIAYRIVSPTSNTIPSNIALNNDKLEISLGMAELKTKSVLKELDTVKYDWKDMFINSPLENNNTIGTVLNPVIDLLNTNLLLHFLMLYLIFMVLFIYSTKILVDKNINLNTIKILPLGYYIHFILNILIKTWTTNATLWIYFTLINLFIFTLVSCYSLYHIIIALNSINI